jgi:hypothetical protein
MAAARMPGEVRPLASLGLDGIIVTSNGSQVARHGHHQRGQEDEGQVEAVRELHLAVRACKALALGF